MREHLAQHFAAVCEAYGIVVVGSYEPMRAGYVALVHRVCGDDGRVYVFKTYDDARPISRMILPTLTALTHATVWLERQPGMHDRIVAPINSREPVRTGAYTTVVFPYIDGVTPREVPLSDVQLRHLVHTVATMHTLSAGAQGLAGVPREDYDAVWTSDILPALQRVDTPDHVLSAVFAGRAGRLAAQFRAFRHRATQLAGRDLHGVVCHTDIHGYNVVIHQDMPLLIDWEGMKVAPKEHDLLFWYGTARWELVWQTYQTVHPDAQIDLALIDYYRMRRLFEDIIQDVERIEQELPVGQECTDLCQQIASALAVLDEMSAS